MNPAATVAICIYSPDAERLFVDDAASQLDLVALEPTLQSLVADVVRHQQEHLSVNLDVDSGLSCQVSRLPSGDVLFKLIFGGSVPEAHFSARLATFQQHSTMFLQHLLGGPVGSDFFDAALGHAIKLIPAAQTGSILRRGPDDRFHFVASAGFDVNLLQEVSFNDDEVYYSFNHRSTSFVVTDIDTVNVELDERRNTILREVGRADHILSTLVVPLTVDDRATAFFTLDNFDSETAFTPDDQRLGEMFAVHVGVVMRLLDYNSRFRQIFYNVPYATLIVRRDLSVVGANATFIQMTGMAAEGASLASLSLLTPHDVAVLEELAPGSHHAWETRLQDAAGGSWCRLSVQHVVLDEPLYLVTLLDLTKTRESEEALRKVIDKLTADTYMIVNRVRESLAEIRPELNMGQPTSLSERERILLSHLANGLTAIQISQILGLAPGTVNNNLTALYGKLGVDGRVQAALWAKERGLE